MGATRGNAKKYLTPPDSKIAVDNYYMRLCMYS